MFNHTDINEELTFILNIHAYFTIWNLMKLLIHFRLCSIRSLYIPLPLFLLSLYSGDLDCCLDGLSRSSLSLERLLRLSLDRCKCYFSRL